MKNQDIYKYLSEIGVQLNAIYLIGASALAAPDELIEQFEYEGQEWVEKKCGIELSQQYSDTQDIVVALAAVGKCGFFIRASTAFPRSFTPEGLRGSHSWGYTANEWFYTEFIDAEFMRALTAWRDKVVKDAYEAHNKKPKGAKLI
jgi:hypothetical protein